MKKNLTTQSEDKCFDFEFGKTNYILLVCGIVLLIIGYILLSGGGSDNPEEFNPAMFDGRRLFVAPILITVGFIVEILAIMYRGKHNTEA